ncbi:uncharacterized protein ACA1_020510 [Acanthamoeba castellanii str. Neff]|uniref:Uncharacterized protein n=1 Tax=Acanthamoeba castellanii (strain ATCC 30010 / Neff) TaxID=1257118 RepID=L8GVH1_ACACF|nr:uncharacterized protein ACA1_020510 [Acanthamoeba castellanii str. Neff]ELR17015.1 hypothetical protein ACA1_020510 [Acanthamoeba castellanii str. Neff]
MHTLTVLLLLAMLATLATSQGSPLYFGTTMFTFHTASSPLANCIHDTSATASPLKCNISNSDLTLWTLTGPTVTPGDEALSPTTPAMLNPYGSGSLTQWCIPKNSTSYLDQNTVLCNSVPILGWLMFIKTSGYYGNGIFSSDQFAILNVCNGKFCTMGGVGMISCNTEDIAFAT